MKTKIGHDSAQLDLLDRPTPNAGPALKRALAQAIAAGQYSRAEIVERLNALAEAAGLDREVTEDALNKWTAQSATKYQIPVTILPLLCRVLDDFRPLAVYLDSFGADIFIINAEQKALLAWAAAEQERERSQKRAKALKQMLEIGK